MTRRSEGSLRRILVNEMAVALQERWDEAELDNESEAIYDAACAFDSMSVGTLAQWLEYQTGKRAKDATEQVGWLSPAGTLYSLDEKPNGGHGFRPVYAEKSG